ncbi:ComEC family competence protein [Lacihabitans sp. LS3-19]|uniref:ComEC/Rec2 family competence protein n=1 Tax=Lacihabitans sp. LS3-19 TaxID=2487335 RepID=UPI0020CCCD96|nr:ComEC/Rec2 family competence protein [Lacihabitans sp. LS3-19]MCP9769699.1 ComEC family competence protein [Lacihabitans sp. LS3-19]
MFPLKSIPTLRYFVLLVLGIYLSERFHPSLLEICVFLGTISFLGGISFLSKKLRFFRHSVPFLFLGLGFLSYYFYNQKNNPDHITKMDGFENYMAVIDSYTETKPKTYKVTAEIFAVKKDSLWKKASGKTMLYFNKEAGTMPKFGEVFIIKNSFREIEPPKNPLEFDYKTYQARRNIYTHHFLRDGDFVNAGVSPHKGILYYGNKLNVYTHTVFKQILDNPKQMGVAEAMIGGMKAELDFETKQWYSATGAIHVLAVSGMHVAILFFVINAFFGLFVNKDKPLFLFLILVSLWSYAVFTGLSASVCRSTLMFSMIQIGVFIKRDNNPVNTLLLSAIILLLIVPNWIYEVGFQLSYLAVLGILIIYPKFRNLFEIKWKPLRWIWEISAVSISAQILTVPLSIYYFHQFPNYFLLSNPVVSIVSSILIPLGLLSIILFKIPLLGSFLGLLLKWLINALNACIFFIAELPNALTKGFSISVLTVILLYIVISAILLFFKKREVLYLKIASTLIAILAIKGSYSLFQQSKQKEITFHFIPNGSGISIIEGRSATFIASDSLCHEPLIYQFHLKNYYDAKGINQFKTKSLSDDQNALIQNNLEHFEVLRIENSEPSKENFNYLVSSENSLKNLKGLENFDGTIIIDGSNKKWVVDKLKEEASTKAKKMIVLYDTGSKTINFNHEESN